jgi:hypothetical protein
MTSTARRPGTRTDSRRNSGDASVQIDGRIKRARRQPVNSAAQGFVRVSFAELTLNFGFSFIFVTLKDHFGNPCAYPEAIFTTKMPLV